MNTIKDAFAYPFRENGRMILVWGTILGVASDLAGILPMIGLIAVLLLGAYFCAIFFEVMVTSASGSDDCPGFPNLSDLLEDLILPYFKVVAVALFSFLPAILYAFGVDEDASSLPLSLFFILGACYFPMAILSVGILGRFVAISPHHVLPSILRAGGLYWVIVGFLILVFIVQAILIGFLGDVFIVGAIFTSFLAMLALMINGRLIGLLYRNKEEELDWL